jgi:hypothetical protein
MMNQGIEVIFYGLRSYIKKGNSDYCIAHRYKLCLRQVLKTEKEISVNFSLGNLFCYGILICLERAEFKC